MKTTIKNFKLAFDMTNPPFSSKGLTSFLQAMEFTQVENVLIKEGSWTPNNDYLWLWQNIQVGYAPNFFCIMTPTKLVLSILANGAMLHTACPIEKLFFFNSPYDSPLKIDNIFLEGRTNVAAPMEQGVPVDFVCVTAQVAP